MWSQIQCLSVVNYSNKVWHKIKNNTKLIFNQLLIFTGWYTWSSKSLVITLVLRLKTESNHLGCRTTKNVLVFLRVWKCWRRIKLVPSLSPLSSNWSVYAKETQIKKAMKTLHSSSSNSKRVKVPKRSMFWQKTNQFKPISYWKNPNFQNLFLVQNFIKLTMSRVKHSCHKYIKCIKLFPWISFFSI